MVTRYYPFLYNRNMDNLKAEIGNRIKELRALHGMTQEELANRLDVSIKHVSAVERGLSTFSIEHMIELCDILDCDMEYLVRGRSLDDISSYMPAWLIELYSSEDEAEIRLFTLYLMAYRLIHNI